MTHEAQTAQNAVDRIVWSLYARPRAVPAYLDVMAVADALKAADAFFTASRAGHYVLDRHIPVHRMCFADGLVNADDMPAARFAQLVAGAAASTQERMLWRQRWTERALRDPRAYALPAYAVGSICARTGESAHWLATVDDAPDAVLGPELFGFACTPAEIYARFRATVIAATPLPEQHAPADR